MDTKKPRDLCGGAGLRLCSNDYAVSRTSSEIRMMIPIMAMPGAAENELTVISLASRSADVQRGRRLTTRGGAWES